MPRRILIVRNPVAGRGGRALIEATAAALRARGCAVAEAVTEQPDHACALAREASGYDIVVAAGGDGTVNEVAHGLMQRPADERPAFATIPAGTVNVLALETGMPRAPAALAAVLAEGPVHALTVGVADGRHFLLTAGAGVDSAAVRFLSAGLKRVAGRGAYYVALALALAREGRTVFEVEIEGAMHRVSSVIVTKASRYAGDNIVAPGARLDAPDLHVLLGMRHGRWNLTRYGAAYALGRLPRLPDVKIVACRSLRIAGPAGKPVQLDGDNRLSIPVAIGLAATPLQVVVPRPC